MYKVTTESSFLIFSTFPIFQYLKNYFLARNITKTEIFFELYDLPATP